MNENKKVIKQTLKIIKLNNISNDLIISTIENRSLRFIESYRFDLNNYELHYNDLLNLVINHYKKLNLRFNLKSGITYTNEPIGWIKNIKKGEYDNYTIEDHIKYNFSGYLFNGMQRILNGYKLTNC